jgi:hypothetical protein
MSKLTVGFVYEAPNENIIVSFGCCEQPDLQRE